MADFGAGIVERNADRRLSASRDLFDRLYRARAMGEQKRQFNEQMGYKRDHLDYERSKPEPFDLNRTAQELVLKSSMNPGYEPTPEERAIGMTYDLLKGSDKSYIDEMGRPVTMKGNKIFDQLWGDGAPQQMDDESFSRAILTGEMPQEYGSALPQDQSVSRPVSSGESSLPPASPDYMASPKGQIDVGQANIDVQKKAAEADVSPSQKMAETYAAEIGTDAAETESRIRGLGELRNSLNLLASIAEKAPSGLLETTGAKLSNLAGTPSEEALALADFQSGSAITGLQSRINFLKGQGTITDKEAEQAMAFIPGENDSMPVKVRKLKSAVSFIDGLISGAPESLPEKQKGRPGFKYLGKAE